MFKHKHRQPEWHIVVRDSVGEILVSSAMADFALPEETVLALSVEYFNDREPCEIHRAAVHKRAMLTLQDAIEKNADIPLSSLDAAVRRFFPAGSYSVRLAEKPC